VNELFGAAVTDVQAQVESLPVTRFAGAEEWRDYFKAFYGPTIATYRSLATTPERVAELDAALVDLGTRFGFGSTPVTEWEYLLYTAVKR
jgi:hypothetical protein